MRTIILATAAVAALGLAACSNQAEKAADAQADAVEAQGELKADAMENDAKATEQAADGQGEAAEAQAEASADAMRAQADQVEQKADAQAEAIEKK